MIKINCSVLSLWLLRNKIVFHENRACNMEYFFLYLGSEEASALTITENLFPFNVFNNLVHNT